MNKKLNQLKKFHEILKEVRGIAIEILKITAITSAIVQVVKALI